MKMRINANAGGLRRSCRVARFDPSRAMGALCPQRLWIVALKTKSMSMRLATQHLQRVG